MVDLNKRNLKLNHQILHFGQWKYNMLDCMTVVNGHFFVK